ncbi:hypothetical protein C2869_02610 [Saccharobesus litoralis]|uniref:Cytochrome c domain-containing protein n=2 Tax=Saccharobesus litoralis TaxID=2172099 RepID=A0A2S0VXJ2_9ALTE|nr:hypothetical protein C2869_02610 [Saccharobesus litoralis]
MNLGLTLAIATTVTITGCQLFPQSQSSADQVTVVVTAPPRAATPVVPTPKIDETTHKNKGDRKGHNMTDKIPKSEVPPSPILNVEQALNSIQVQDGFAVENVVAEPYIFNPVSLTFDANGRMWVCEMTRYMPDTFGTGENIPEGNIAILEDRDGDGKVDKRTVFLNDVILPRTITLVKGGILYADHTQLFFTEVLEKDGNLVPGKREVVDPTYAKGGSLEHKTNTMFYGMDNWYYNAKSNKKYQTIALDAEVPRGAKEIYRNQYWKLVRGISDYRGQWGVTMDDYGRLYHNGNSSPAQGEYLLPGSLLQNPEFWAKMGANFIGNGDIYSIRMNTGINRGYIEDMLHQTGPNRGKLKRFTAASGSVIYRGDNFPDKFYGMAITPAPAANLISARHVIEKEGELTGENVYPNAEILASTDERFRPVNLYTAPDGSLYIVDMYHGILQHKEFLTTYLSEQIKARNLDQGNNTMGRIYRLRWAEKALGAQPQLANLSPSELVPFLSHANGWWRDTARRLIIEHAIHNEVTTAAAKIQALIVNSDDEKTIINALWTLHGIDVVNLATLQPLLISGSQQVKVAAIAVSNKLDVSEHQAFAKHLFALADSDYRVGLQVALNAGSIQSPLALQASKKVLDTYIGKPFVREAVMSGAGLRSKELVALLGQYPDNDMMYIVNNLGKKPADRTNRAQLSSQGKALYDLGKQHFNGAGACFGCHGADGDGIKGMGPTFWDSEWVVKDKEILAKVMLHGLSGPIKMKWQTWNTSMVMPGMANNPSMTDKDLAAIATYIRNSWGNAADTGSEVKPEFFSQVRKKTAGQSVPYTQKDFKF